MALEEVFIGMLPTFGIMSVPVKEYKFHPERRFRFDMAFVKEKLAVEIEGGYMAERRNRAQSSYGYCP